MKRIVLIYILIASFGFSHAQNLTDMISRSNKWSIVGYTGVARLDTDIKPDYDFSWIMKSPTIDMSIEYNVHPIFSLGVNYGGLIFNQEDEDEKFTTGGAYFSSFISFDFLNIILGKKNKYLSLWGSAGVGVAGMVWPKYETTRDFKGPNQYLHGVSFPPAFLIFPYTVTLEYNVTKRVSLGAHFKYYYTNTGHLESIYRGYYYDQWETFGINLRYKFTQKDTKSVRDQLPDTTSQNIIKQLQQQINQLGQRIDTVENNLASVDYRVIKLEGILSDDGPDTDRDGVPDIRDLEPNTPPGTPVDFWGRSMMVQTLKEEDILSVYFDFDSYELDKIAQITLIKVAQRMAEDPDLLLEIRGYTDYLGTNEYNKKLSRLRAERVKQELVQKYEIPHDRMVANGLGKIPEPPLKSLVNRRCDFFFSK